jgi:hypothetical protein
MIITNESHPTEGEMARLIEGTLDAAERRRIAEHLRSCRDCFETYHDSAVYRWLFESGSPSFASTAETANAGFGIVPGSRVPGGADAEGKRSSLRRRLVFQIAAACIVVFAAAVLWHRTAERDGEHAPRPTELAPVRSALETASQWGPFVLPEGARVLDRPASARRSGSVPMNDSLKFSLDRLYSLYRADRASSGAVYFLIAGKYVTGQIDIARDLAIDARRKYPEDPRIAVVEALIAYSDGDLERSARLLRAIIEREPDDPIASLDLAIVLAAKGDNGEARELLKNVRERFAGTPLAARAETLLKSGAAP